MQWRLPRFKFTRRVVRIGTGVIAAVLLVMALAAWQVPRVLRGVLTENVATMLGRDVSAGKITFNPFTLTVRVRDLKIARPQEAAPLFEVERLQFSAAWSSLFWFAPVVDSVVIHRPRAALVREEAAHFNFSDIVARVAALTQDSPGQALDESRVRFSLNNLVLEDGSVTLDDKVTGRKQVVDQLTLGVPFISNFGYATDIDVQPRIHARINGSTFDLDGTTRPFDAVPSSVLNLNLAGLDLEPWADAWPVRLPFKLKSGVLDSTLKLAFEQPKDAPARLRVAGDVQVSAFDLQENAGGDLLKWDSLQLNGVDFLPFERSLHLKQVILRKPEVQARRDARQRVNWLEVVDKLAQVQGKPAAQATPPPAAAAPANATPAQAPWRIGVDGIDLQSATVYVRDAATKLDYTLKNVNFTTGPIVLPQKPDQPIAFQVNTDNQADGWIATTGTLAIAPLKLDLDVRAGHLGLAPFAPIVRSLAPIVVRQGRIDLAAQVSLASRDGGMAVSAKDVRAELRELALTDESVTPAVNMKLAQLTFTADRLSTRPGAIPFALRATGMQGAGSLDAQGTLNPQPLGLDMRIHVDRLDLASFAPYIQSSLNAKVKALALNARGEVKFSAAQGKAPMRADWKGAVEVNNLDLADRVTGDDFMKWKQLGFDAMAVSVAGSKFGVDLGNVVLSDFYGRVVLSQQGRLNVMDLVARPGRAGGSITQDTQTSGRLAESASSSAMPDIGVRSVTLKSGRVTFSDRFVRPNYTAELSAISGSVSAVSSSKPSPARIKIGGRVYRSAPFSLEGVVHPFAKFLALDLKASAKGVDLPRFNTYAAKYVGYTVKRGKLSLDLEYKLKDRALQASNKVLLTQLTLGDKTNSPDATKLPVMLAVALLRDRHGNIDLNLPVSGSLDDPSFSIGGIIVQVVANLLSKAITSPFTLLASAFGGGEELSYVDFPRGSAQLSDAARSRIQRLSQALNDRTGLKLDISGRADPQTDAEGLREQWLEQRMRAAKADDLSTRVKKIAAADVTVSNEEYDKYLEQAFDATDFKNKPRNLIGLSKSLPAEQMRTLMLAAAPTGRRQLQELADARAQAVHELLQESVSDDRLFIVAVAPDSSGSEDGGSASRVDFSLK